MWAAVLGAEGGFDVNWLGTNTTETRFGLPLTVSAGNGSYWCIKSRQADPDLIILGHLKIYSPTPGSNTCPMSSLHATKTCPRVCPPSFAHHPLLSIRSICICCFIYCLYFLQSTQLTQDSTAQVYFPLGPICTKTFQISCLRREAWRGRWRLYDFSLLAKSEKP